MNHITYSLDFSIITNTVNKYTTETSLCDDVVWQLKSVHLFGIFCVALTDWVHFGQLTSNSISRNYPSKPLLLLPF